MHQTSIIKRSLNVLLTFDLRLVSKEKEINFSWHVFIAHFKLIQLEFQKIDLAYS